jgi:hypothetical protein
MSEGSACSKSELATHGQSSGSKLEVVWNLLAVSWFRTQVLGADSAATGDQSKRYRHYASECFRLAQLAPTSPEKDLLLQMAETWRRLAEQAENSRKLDPD